MKIPHRVRIKARVAYDVVYADVIQDDPDCLGLCDFENRQIIIKNGQSEKETLKTFAHELFHSWEHEFKITIKHKDIYLLEDAVFNFLTLNKLI